MTGNYVTTWRDGIESLRSIDGLMWYDAPLPPREHDCFPQTIGFVLKSHVERCACGAISPDGVYWMDRNSRRDPEPRRPWWRRLLSRPRG